MPSLESEPSSSTAKQEVAALSLEAYEHVAHGVTISDCATTRIRHCNPAFANLLGWAPHELIGRPVVDFYPPAERERARARLADTEREGALHFETELLRRDGTHVPVEIAVVLVRDAQGRPLYRVASAKDLSVRRRAEAERDHREQQFRLLFAHSLDAILLTTPDGKILSANPAACAMFGCSEEEICRLGRGGLVDSTDSRLANLLARRESDGNVRGGLRLFRRDGTTFEAELSSALYTDPDGQRRASMIIRDLSERQRAEEIALIQRDLAIGLAGATEVIEGVTLCLDAAIRAAGLDSGGFYLLDAATGELDLAVHRGVSAAFVECVRHYPANSPQARIVRSSQPLYTTFREIQSEREAAAWKEGLKFFAAVPVHFEGKAIGSLNLSSHIVDSIDSTARKALEAIAADAAQAIARLRTEDALRKERERQANILAGTRAATWEWNVQTGETVFNEMWAEIVGYTLAELEPTSIKTWERFSHPDDLQCSVSLLQRHFTGELPSYECECRLRHRDGRWVWVLDRGRLLSRTADGKPLMMFGTHTDITALKLADAALRQSERNYREIFNATNDAIFVHDVATGRVIDVNDGMLRMYGFASKEEYLACPPTVTFVDEPGYGFDEAMRRMQLAAQGSPQVFEWKTRMKGGDVLWVDVSLRSVQIGGHPSTLAVVRDITRRKQAEDAFREVEARFSQAFQYAPSLMSISRMSDGTYLDVNACFLEISGFCRDEVIGRRSVDLGWTSAEDRARMMEILRVSGRMRDLEIPLTGKGGKHVDVLYAGELITVGGQELLLSNAVDITERKRAERAMRESEEKFLKAFHRSPSIKSITRFADGVYLDVNDRFLEVFGFQREEVVGARSVDVGLLNAEQRADLMAKLAAHGTVEKQEATLPTKSGRWVDVRYGCELLSIGGEPYVLWNATDVTAQKQAESALKASEQQYRLLFDGNPNPMWVFDEESLRFLAVNERAALHYGWSHSEFLDLTLLDIRLEEDRALAKEIVQRNQGVKERPTGIVRHRRRDGSLILVEITSTSIRFADRAARLCAIIDVTERERLQAERLEVQERYRGFIESAFDGIIIHQGGRIVEANQAYARMFGYTVEELIGKPVLELSAPEWRAVAQGKIQAQSEEIYESVGLRRDGSRVPIETAGKACTFRGRAARMAAVRDITMRKHAEQTLRLHSRVLNAMAEGVILVRLEDTRIVFTNEVAEKMLGYGPGELVGKMISAINGTDDVDPEEKSRVIGAAVRTHGRWQGEVLNRRKDGSSVWCLATVSAFHDPVFGDVGILIHQDITERKQAEEALRMSERRFLSVFEASPAAIGISRAADGKFIEVNGAFLQLYGYDREEIIGNTSDALGLVHEGWRSQVIAELRKEGNLRNVTLNARRKDGRILNLLASLELVELAGESCIIGILTDVTELNQAQRALAVSEDRYRSLVETSFDWVWEVDSAGRYTYASPQVRELLGFSPDEVIGRTPFDLMPVEEAQRVGRIFQQFAANHAPIIALENTNVHRDGQLVVVETNAIPLYADDGSWIGYRGMDRDITASREAQRTLRLHGAALEYAANAIIISGRDDLIEWVNPAFTTLSGWTFEEARGRKPGELLNSGMHEEAFYRQMAETVEAGKVWSGEMINRRKDGTNRTEDVTVTPLRDESGRITHFISIKQDVTERKSLEAQNRQAQRMEAIGTLASGIAHDLNNILAPMLMVPSLLKPKLPDDQDQEILAMLHQGAQRGASIIKQLLTFSRGLGGERTAVQIKHLVKEIGSIIRETFPRDIELRLDTPVSLPLVHADPTQIHQVLLNLCVNARDAMPEGGHLSIVTSSVTLPPGDFRLPLDRSPGQYVLIEVRDSGHGVPPELLERIFDPFFTTKPIGKGTGLGLSTVLGIVRSHQGFIIVDSPPRQGTAFRVFLPALAESPAPAEPVTVVPRTTARGHLILVVDDERSVRESTRLVLEARGFRVLVAVNGKDALAQFLARRREVALVLTDIMMPVMNGVALAKALRAFEPALPIVATSGMAELTNQEELAALGVNDIVAKPCSGAALLEMLDQKLSGNNAANPRAGTHF